MPKNNKTIAYGRNVVSKGQKWSFVFSRNFKTEKKDKGEGMWISDNYNPYLINPDSFPEVQWSDEEPTKVKLVIDK